MQILKIKITAVFFVKLIQFIICKIRIQINVMKKKEMKKSDLDWCYFLNSQRIKVRNRLMTMQVVMGR